MHLANNNLTRFSCAEPVQRVKLEMEDNNEPINQKHRN